MSREPDAFSPLASVVYFRIPEFAQLPVGEQAKRRAQLDDAVATASAPLQEADRVVLDAPDGAAMVVLANPGAALLAARRALTGSPGGHFAVGINHGPVTLAAGERNDSRLIGDGIDTAISVAGFAPPGGLLVARAFRDALADGAPELADTLHHAGTFTDANIRAHELFATDDTALRALERRRISFVVLACIGILTLGLGARFALQSLAESRQPAFLVFDIRPQGEIYLDGVMKGKAPAVTRLQVAAGTHTLEVRHDRFPSFVTEVNLKPGEEMHVRHSFTAPAAKKSPALLERLKFW